MSDFDREVYCIAGLPFDAVDMNQAISAVRHAKYINKKCFMSTPNINFLATAVNDPEFLKSVIYSDLVVADGTPIVWMAKLLGIPINQRVAGSSLFQMLDQEKRRKMKVYFMGGLDGVAEAASNQINEKPSGLTCVGHYSPGFGSVEDMSTDEIINNINSSKADFLVVALGAKKGQAWILKNIDRITIPLVSHLGAVINFEAKRIKRAPKLFQNSGFEWMWRIKEEPELWRRYYGDAIFFAKLLTNKILPFYVWKKVNEKRLLSLQVDDALELTETESSSQIKVRGALMGPINSQTRQLFRGASKSGKSVEIDLSEAEYVSFGFLGLVLMLKKVLDAKGLNTHIVNCNKTISKIIDWNGLNYLKA